MLPALALTMPQMMLMRVVLPAPLGPSSAKISPEKIFRSIHAERCETVVVDLGHAGDVDGNGTSTSWNGF